MEEIDYDWLSNLDDSKLLEIIAFQESNYTPEGWYTLNQELKGRGLTTESITQYREASLRTSALNYECQECGTEVVLDRNDLLAGRFICPDCKTEQLIEYPERIYGRSSETEIEPDVGVEEDEPQPSVDPQESESDTAPAEPSDQVPVDETLAKGMSGVTCAYCEKELRAEEVFEDGGEFYCADCFKDAKKRTIELEEEEPEDEYVNEDPIGWRYAPLTIMVVGFIFIAMQIFECSSK